LALPEIDFIQSKIKESKAFKGNKIKEICTPPTSVESERAFFITGQFATKLRTKLDETLSSLVVF
jgi:hypothetical protein